MLSGSKSKNRFTMLSGNLSSWWGLSLDFLESKDKQPVFGALALLGPSGLAERLGPCRVGRGGRSLRALLHPPWKPRPPFPLTDALGKSLWERRRGVLTGHELGPCVRCCET